MSASGAQTRVATEPATASGTARLVLRRKCACGSSTSSLTDRCDSCQASRSIRKTLTIGASDDPLEREADRIADQVTRDPSATNTRGKSLQIQLAALPVAGNGPDAPASVAHALNDPGRPLEIPLRTVMEQQFGHDFSQVRLHVDGAAARSAHDVQARAYTAGQHVVFGAGQFSPTTDAGRRLLAHELTHVVQQGGAGRVQRCVDTRSLSPGSNAEDEVDRLKVEGVAPSRALVSSVDVPVIRRDLAIDPPHPRAVGRVLSAAAMLAAVAFNQRVVAVIGASGIHALRDVLAITPEPPLIDEDFVRAVVLWQAIQGLTQDGRLGPGTAAPLFREIGAEHAGRAELVTGPTYAATLPVAPPVVGGRQQAGFTFRAEFADDPANGLFPSCGEVHQFIQWDAAYAAAGGVPHAGFPAGTAADTWIEDRDNANLRYGHRSGPFSDLQVGDQYLDNANANPAFGHRYDGRDFPAQTRHAGHFRFMVRAVDVCNGNRALRDDFLRITWA